jgi:hypothetical protein
MYGFCEDYRVAIDCVAELQQHIDSRFTAAPLDPPQVGLSLGPYAAVIDVMFGDGEIQLWHSEADSAELTPETLIGIYAAKCETMSKQFVA